MRLGKDRRFVKYAYDLQNNMCLKSMFFVYDWGLDKRWRPDIRTIRIVFAFRIFLKSPKNSPWAIFLSNNPWDRFLENIPWDIFPKNIPWRLFSGKHSPALIS